MVSTFIGRLSSDESTTKALTASTICCCCVLPSSGNAVTSKCHPLSLHALILGSINARNDREVC